MGGKFDRGENSMFIVGVGRALIYPTEAAQTRERRTRTLAACPYTMRTGGNLSEANWQAEAREISKQANERAGAVPLYCSRLRGPLTRRSDWYFACFRSFAPSADRPRKCLEVYARRLQENTMPVI
jgi:hypothetical protein